ncbi:Minor cardiolipin synthase ClsB [Bacillus sp. CECT 9360]|nr:Minor cardiolipin synthase ClsB [Bacillus sp. CECT 9360]
MIITITIGVVIICFLVWLPLDFHLGRRRHKRKVFKKNLPNRQSDIQLYTNGKKLFNDFFHEIQDAKKYVHILFYIVSNDQFSKAFLQLLKEKAQTGVEVRLMIDRIGGYRVSKKMISDLKAHGVRFTFTNSLKFPYLFYSLNKRNHRKITIIDSEIGYLGGYNVGKEYIDQDSKLSPWRDYHLKVTGEGVQDLQYEYFEDWFRATGEDQRSNQQYFPSLKKGDCLHRFLPTEGIFLEKAFSEMILTANERIIVGTPYFIPSRKLFSDLRKALTRGIDLTVIVPKTADHLFVQEASYPFFRVLLKEGAKIMQFEKGFYHSKIILIDDKVCDIGTANFDRRSLFLNREMNCLIYDKACIEDIKKELDYDIFHSTPLTIEMITTPNPVRMFKESIAYAISPFL